VNITNIPEEISALLTQRQSLNLITDEDPNVKSAKKLIVRFSRERELPIIVGGSRFAHALTHIPFRGFGINE
jgi:hypothetical protein